MKAFLVLFLSLSPSLAVAENACRALFAGPLVSNEVRPHLPPLFSNPKADLGLIALYLETKINHHLRWSYSLGEVKVTEITDLYGDGVAYARIEFSLKGEVLDTEASTYVRIESKNPEVANQDLTSIYDVAGVRGGVAPLEIRDLPLMNTRTDLSPVDRRQMEQDLVRAANYALLDITDAAIAKAGTNRDFIKTHLELQKRRLWLVDSPFSAQGENPALWVLRLYIENLELL